MCAQPQARICLTRPALWQKPWQGHLQESWMYSHQTLKRKVGITCIYVLNILTIFQCCILTKNMKFDVDASQSNKLKSSALKNIPLCVF